MKIRMKAPLFVIGKPTQQGKKDVTVTYYYITCSQGEDDAGKIRVTDVDTYNRIEKYKQQLFTFEFNDQYNSFSIVDVEPIKEASDKGIVESVAASASASNAGTPTADTTAGTPAGKSDKK